MSLVETRLTMFCLCLFCSLLNMTCFLASSKLLASISSYQYTRRTWRRDVYDILLSPDFFKMDVQSLQFWKILADNLVTHEKTMFKDLLGLFSFLYLSSCHGSNTSYSVILVTLSALTH